MGVMRGGSFVLARGLMQELACSESIVALGTAKLTL